MKATTLGILRDSNLNNIGLSQRISTAKTISSKPNSSHMRVKGGQTLYKLYKLLRVRITGQYWGLEGEETVLGTFKGSRS